MNLEPTELDHRDMDVPFLRVASRILSASGLDATVWDFRVGQPNVAAVPGPVLHSLEHMLAVYLKERSDSVLNVGVMGCRTGFYIITLGAVDFGKISRLVAQALEAIQAATEVVLANPSECGAAEYHSLAGAQEAARWLLSRRADWAETVRRTLHDQPRSRPKPSVRCPKGDA
ncbi:S-ribosylhomocysteine lyase [Candidatus Protofrankia californiensis]|uniref:S-ribosylhomocysteine lyase n=1 Tax=Candidatus Protofrankia californiensis TaxID=1839754 RepID=UPI00104168CE|nr:S-ribosylhomocysteine lyase [Candidatus Protofrankia californiensis]